MVLSTVVRQSEEPAILYSPMACCISKQVGGGPPTKDFSRVTSTQREVEEGGEREKGKDRHMYAQL